MSDSKDIRARLMDHLSRVIFSVATPTTIEEDADSILQFFADMDELVYVGSADGNSGYYITGSEHEIAMLNNKIGQLEARLQNLVNYFSEVYDEGWDAKQAGGYNNPWKPGGKENSGT